MKAKTQNVVLGVALFVAMFLLGVGVYLSGRVIGSVWVIWCAIAGLALLSGTTMWRLWKPLTRDDGFVWNFVIHGFVATAVLGALFFGLNYFGRKEGTAHQVRAVVVNKYQKEREEMRTVGRRRVATGRKIRTYYIECQFDDGQKYENSVKLKRYLGIQRGDSVTFTVASGFFGLPVVGG